MWGSGTRQTDAGGDPHLVEDVAQVGFDGLLTEEQLCGDLVVRLAIDDEPRDLELTSRQGLDAEWLVLTGPRSPMWSVAEPSQLSLGARPVAQRAAGIEGGGRALVFYDGTVALARSRQSPARERARQR